MKPLHEAASIQSKLDRLERDAMAAIVKRRNLCEANKQKLLDNASPEAVEILRKLGAVETEDVPELDVEELVTE